MEEQINMKKIFLKLILIILLGGYTAAFSVAPEVEVIYGYPLTAKTGENGNYGYHCPGDMSIVCCEKTKGTSTQNSNIYLINDRVSFYYYKAGINYGVINAKVIRNVNMSEMIYDDYYIIDENSIQINNNHTQWLNILNNQ